MHARWSEIVFEGSRNALGMPGFESWGMTEAEAQAIRAYVIEQAWKAYQAPREQPE